MTLVISLRAAMWSALSLALSACSVVNTDHCANQNGNATCLQRDASAPYCSICVPDNNGCLAAAPPSGCLADTAPATSADAASSAGTTTNVDPTSTSTSTSTSTGEPTTTSSTSTTTTDLTTSSSTSTGDTSTGDTGTSTDDTTTGDTTTGTSTGDTTTSTTTDTTMGGPVCGDGKAEGDEVCDGMDFKGETCKTVIGGKWGGGSLGCNQCQSLNDGKCCVGLNGACGVLAPDAKLPCCIGLTCKVEGLNGYKCKSQ